MQCLLEAASSFAIAAWHAACCLQLHQGRQAALILTDQPVCLADGLRPFLTLQGSAHWAMAGGASATADWSSRHLAEAVAFYHRAAAGSAGTADAAQHIAFASLKLALLCNGLLQVG